MAKVTWNESNTIGSIDFSARKFADKKGSPKACARVAGFVADMSAADVKYMNDQVDFVLHRSKENATYQKERTDRKPLTPEKLADLINTQKLRIQEHGFNHIFAKHLNGKWKLNFKFFYTSIYSMFFLQT